MRFVTTMPKTIERASSAPVFKHSRRAAWRKVANEAVILDVETAVYFSLADAGLRMWELIGDGKSADEIAAILSREYDAPRDTIRRDCAELIDRLRREKMIEPA